MSVFVFSSLTFFFSVFGSMRQIKLATHQFLGACKYIISYRTINAAVVLVLSAKVIRQSLSSWLELLQMFPIHYHQVKLPVWFSVLQNVAGNSLLAMCLICKHVNGYPKGLAIQ